LTFFSWPFFFSIISSRIDNIGVDKLNLEFISAPKWNPIILSLEDLDIIGEPDDPKVVEQLCLNFLLLIDKTLPKEKHNSFPFGYCNINISNSIILI
jgi:hypothetical protein